MAGKWEDKGPHAGSIADELSQMIDGSKERHIVNTETGEEKIALVGRNQTLGEAIEKGQVRDDDCSKK